MSIDDRELSALVFLALRVRKSTSSAGPWDEPGLVANLRKLQNRNLHMTIEHVLRHAADPKAKNPGVILGSFTPDAPKGGGAYFPPKRSEECRKHPGQWPGSCAACATDDVLAWHDDDRVKPTMTSDRPGNTEAGVSACRAGRAAAKGGES